MSSSKLFFNFIAGILFEVLDFVFPHCVLIILASLSLLRNDFFGYFGDSLLPFAKVCFNTGQSDVF